MPHRPPSSPPRSTSADPLSPRSPRFDDVYHARPTAPSSRRRTCSWRGNDLPARWQGRDAFTILETGFGLGNNFLATWAAWRADARRSARLRFVSHREAPAARRPTCARALAGSSRARPGRAAVRRLAAADARPAPAGVRRRPRRAAAGAGRRRRAAAPAGRQRRRVLPRRLRARAQSADVGRRASSRPCRAWPRPARRPPPGAPRARCATGCSRPASTGAPPTASAASATSRWPLRAARAAAQAGGAHRRARRTSASPSSAAASRARRARRRSRARACDARCSIATRSPRAAPRATSRACSTACSIPKTACTRARTARPRSPRVTRDARAIAAGVPGQGDGLVRLAPEHADAGAAGRGAAPRSGLPPEYLAGLVGRPGAGRRRPGLRRLVLSGRRLDLAGRAGALVAGEPTASRGAAAPACARLDRDDDGWHLFDASGAPLATADAVVFANAGDATALWSRATDAQRPRARRRQPLGRAARVHARPGQHRGRRHARPAPAAAADRRLGLRADADGRRRDVRRDDARPTIPTPTCASPTTRTTCASWPPSPARGWRRRAAGTGRPRPTTTTHLAAALVARRPVAWARRLARHGRRSPAADRRGAAAAGRRRRGAARPAAPLAARAGAVRRGGLRLARAHLGAAGRPPDRQLDRRRAVSAAGRHRRRARPGALLHAPGARVASARFASPRRPLSARRETSSGSPARAASARRVARAAGARRPGAAPARAAAGAPAGVRPASRRDARTAARTAP